MRKRWTPRECSSRAAVPADRRLPRPRHARHRRRASFAWRAGGSERKRHDYETHDRHGVVRCKHCGGPTNFVRFSPGDQSRPENERNPRLWVDCMLGSQPGCAKTQTISCKTDWRLLVPLWRTDPLYRTQREPLTSLSPIGGALATRSPPMTSASARRSAPSAGIACARTRPLIEWLRICSREGWLSSARRNYGEIKRGFAETGRRIASRLAEMRVRMGVAEAYGNKAARLDIGKRTPPSRRARGAPPGQSTLDFDIST